MGQPCLCLESGQHEGRQDRPKLAVKGLRLAAGAPPWSGQSAMVPSPKFGLGRPGPKAWSANASASRQSTPTATGVAASVARRPMPFWEWMKRRMQLPVAAVLGWR